MADDPKPDDDVVDDTVADEAADDAADDTVDDAADDAADDTTDDADDTADDTAGTSASRGETRQQKLANELRAERDARIRAEAERDVVRNNNTRQSDPAAAARVREEKLALMTPEERGRFEDRELIASMQQESALTRLQTQDTLDKMAYKQMAATDPVAAKYEKEVEELLASMRRDKSNAPRETLLNYIIGKHAREAARNPKTKRQLANDKAAAAARKAQAKGAAPGGRGDVANEGRKRGGEESLEEMRQRLLDREARGDM